MMPSFEHKDTLLSLYTKPANYKSAEDSISISHTGYLLFQFTRFEPYSEGDTDLQPEIVDDNLFSLDIYQLGEILTVSPQEQFAIPLEFQSRQNGLLRVLKFEVQDLDCIRISLEIFKILPEDQQLSPCSFFEISVSKSEIQGLQKSIQFWLPHLLGWGALESNKFIFNH